MPEQLRLWPSRRRADTTPMAMNPCLRKACKPNLDLSSDHPGLDEGLLTVLGLEHGGVAHLVVGDEDPVAVAALPQAGLPTRKR